jgi:hypothetical protein
MPITGVRQHDVRRVRHSDTVKFALGGGDHRPEVSDVR